jgi:hypothetical protein
MHATAEANAKRFFETYVNKVSNPTIAEIGSQIGGNGAEFNIRSLAPKNSTYIGIDLEKLPGVDEVTFRPNGDVRAYVRMTDDAIANGAKIEHKFYGVYQFNKEHKIIFADEYMDITGAVKAATEVKK